VLIVIAAIGLVWLIVTLAQQAAARQRERLAALAAWANRNGFAFDEQDQFDLDARFNGVFEIGRGHARYAFEVLTRSEPVPVWIFRYHFKTWETRTVRRNNRTYTETYEETHWRAYLIIELGAVFPPLAIRAENWFDKVAGFIGFDDIDFESEEFSSRYHVKSADRQFAYAVIHPQMMEWLLPQRLALQLDRGLLLMDLSSVRFEAVTCHAAWSQATGFVNRIPPFVWHDYAEREKLEFPAAAPPVTMPAAPGV
jgi:hypothetical protein